MNAIECNQKANEAFINSPLVKRCNKSIEIKAEDGEYFLEVYDLSENDVEKLKTYYKSLDFGVDVITKGLIFVKSFGIRISWYAETYGHNGYIPLERPPCNPPKNDRPEPPPPPPPRSIKTEANWKERHK